ncbi:hypothetical protein L7F22_048130 [Adiantum nelumboides]|nr:hypothetical protein [Adiantum nelumboides]
MTESQAMALLYATVGISICARSELAKAMAVLHMNLVLRVSKDRSRIYIGLPAEPILAEGAVSALRYNKVQEGALNHLLAACKVGYVTPGPRGEFVAKFILVATMWDKEIEWHLWLISMEMYLEKLLVNDQENRRAFDQVKATCPEVLVHKPPATAMLERVFASGYALLYRVENTLLEKVSTNKVRSEFTKVEIKLALICITLVMSLREPIIKDSVDGLLWVSPQEDVATDMDPYINLTCYGIDGNYSYLTKNVKELLKVVLITVPNELAGATNKEKEWIKGLLPKQYI